MKHIRNILDYIFNRWTKWEVYQTNKRHTKWEVNPITGWQTAPHEVTCDIFKKINKYTGMVKYKTVEKG